MDDFNVSSLHESKNEWGARLVTILTPLVTEGLKSIFDEAINLCKTNNEMDKYLMTFQNFISRIPKWNSTIIEIEKNRIVEKSRCSYLEDLITCVHIIQLKLLTAIRVGQKQKKIDISIPKLEDFIHKVYINVARKIYKNVYLYEINIPPLQIQKHHRELEIIIQECILNTVRESIPIESILRAYMDETVEDDVVEEIKEEVIEVPKEDTHDKSHKKPHVISEIAPTLETQNSNSNSNIGGGNDIAYNTNNTNNTDNIEFPSLSEDTSSLSFSDIDHIRDSNNNEMNVTAPKTYERLDEISSIRNAQRKKDEEEDDNSYVKLNIQDNDISLDNFDVHVLDPPDLNLNSDFLLNDIEVLA